MKKLSKNIMILLLIIMILASSIATGSVSAAQSGMLSVSSVSADIDETVDVDITLSENPGIVGMTLDVKYDSTVLELIEVKDKGILGANSHKPELRSPYTLSWSNDTSTTNYTTNGVIATLTFKITDNAEKGSTYPIEISYDYDNYGIYDKDTVPVMFNTSNGAITVESGETVHTHSMTKIEAKASDCQTQGNNEYYYCADCGKYFKDAAGNVETTVADETLPLTAHNYVEDASAEYLRSEATCTAPAEYYKSCSVCGERSDETFTYGEPDAHEYSSEWKYDADSHWRECVNCSDIADKAAHVSGGAATEDSPEVCTVCGYVIAPALEHTHKLTLVSEVDATCIAEGHIAYYVCTGCGKWFADGTAAVEITDHNSVVTPLTAHNYVEDASAEYLRSEATCTAPAEYYKSCSVCGERSDETFTYGEPDAHEYSSEWKYDADSHWRECVNCADIADKADHVSGGAATEDSPEICTVCGYVITPALGHTHKLTYVSKVDATCTTKGNTSYYVCDGCGKWFADSSATTEITDHSSVETPKIAHTPSDWITDKEATETEQGARHKECTVCGEILEEELIPVIPTQPADIVPSESEPQTGESQTQTEESQTGETVETQTQTEEPQTGETVETQTQTEESQTTETQETEKTETQAAETEAAEAQSTETEKAKSTVDEQTANTNSGSSSAVSGSASSNSGVVQTGSYNFIVVSAIAAALAIAAAYVVYYARKRKTEK